MIERKELPNKVTLDLDGPDGNAFVLLGIANGYCKTLDFPPEVDVIEEMQSGDYTNLVKTFDKYFGDFVILQTTNEELLA